MSSNPPPGVNGFIKGTFKFTPKDKSVSTSDVRQAILNAVSDFSVEGSDLHVHTEFTPTD